MNDYDQDGLFALLILFDFMLAWQISHRFDIILSSCGAHSVFSQIRSQNMWALPFNPLFNQVT